MLKDKSAGSRNSMKILLYYILPILLVILVLLQPQFANETVRTILSNIFIAMLVVVFFAVIIYFSLRWMKALGYGPKEYKIIGVSLLILLTIGVLFFFLFFHYEKDIKVYDNSTYWIRVLESREMGVRSLASLIGSTVDSLHTDYTYVAAVPLVPLSYIFGTEYAGYTFSIFLLYCVPACFLLALYAMRLIHKVRKQAPSVVSFVMCIIFGAIFPSMIWPILNGYVDICGVLIIALMLNITLHYNGSAFSWKHIMALSALSLLLIFARRWYAYYLIGFFVAMGVDVFLTMWRKRAFSGAALRNFIWTILLVGGISSIVVLLLNRSVFAAFLTVDYSSAYAMAKTMTWWENLWQMVQNWGLLWFFIALVGAGIVFTSKNTRLLSMRLIVASALSFALFSTVQNLDMHHFYLVTPTILVFSYVFCDATVQFMRVKKGPVFFISLVAVGVINFSVAFMPLFQGIYTTLLPFTTTAQQYPKVFTYYDATKEIIAKLREDIGNEADLVYVVGSTENLSAELLKRAELPTVIDSAPFAVYTHISDSRDGFPSHLFMADYVLLNDPFVASYENVQQVNYQVYDMLINDPAVSSYYELVDSFKEGRQSVLLYKRVLPADKALVDNLKTRMQAYYPDTPKAYEPAYILSLFDYDRSDTVVYDYWEKSFTYKHDGTKPLEMGWVDVRAFTEVQFQLQTKNTPMEVTVENQDGELMRMDLDIDAWEDITLDIEDSEFVNITVTPLIQDEYLEFTLSLQGKRLS